jgi:hypothetical protein
MVMSSRPSEAVEGGDFPRGNLLCTKAEFRDYQYMKNDPTGAKEADGTPIRVPVIGQNGKPISVMAAVLVLRNDEGTEFEQAYSVGDPSRYEVLDNGTQLKGVLRQGSNYHKLMEEAVNKGYNESKLTGNIVGDWVGVYANWDTIELPTRSFRGGQEGQPRSMVVPVEFFQFPSGEAKKGAIKAPTVTGRAKAAPTPAPAAPPNGTADMDRLAELVVEMLDKKEGTDRADLSQYVFSNARAEEKLDLVKAIMTLDAETLSGVGITLEGETFSR